MIFDVQDKQPSDWDQMEMALWGLSNAAVYATLCNYAQIGPQSLKSGNGVIMCGRLKVFGILWVFKSGRQVSSPSEVLCLLSDPRSLWVSRL